MVGLVVVVGMDRKIDYFNGMYYKIKNQMYAVL